MFAVLVMLARSIAWGVLSNVQAHNSANGVTAASVTCLTTGLIIASISFLKGENLLAALRVFTLRRLVLVAGLEAGAYACAFQGLHWAPVGLVAALVMTTPVMLIMSDILRGRRQVDIKSLASCGLITAAVAIIGSSRQATGTYPHLWWGLMAALASAGLCAAYVKILKRASIATPATACAALVGISAGFIVAPVALFHLPPPESLVGLVAVGAGISIPALCYFYALKRMPPTTICSLELLQPFWAALIGYCFFGGQVLASQIIAVPLIMAAVFIELRPTRAKSERQLDPVASDTDLPAATTRGSPAP
jgi:drug/metabolite transporter (DMT)-like permease